MILVKTLFFTCRLKVFCNCVTFRILCRNFTRENDSLTDFTLHMIPELMQSRYPYTLLCLSYIYSIYT